MKRLGKALAVLGIVGASMVPLTNPANAHVLGAGGNHLKNCRDFTLITGRPFQPGDGCVMVIQAWVNQARALRLWFGQPVPGAWENLVIDGDWGGATSAAVFIYQGYYHPGVDTGVADHPTMTTMWLHCLDTADDVNAPQAPCDHGN